MGVMDIFVFQSSPMIGAQHYLSSQSVCQFYQCWRQPLKRPDHLVICSMSKLVQKIQRKPHGGTTMTKYDIFHVGVIWKRNKPCPCLPRCTKIPNCDKFIIFI